MFEIEVKQQFANVLPVVLQLMHLLAKFELYDVYEQNFLTNELHVIWFIVLSAVI